MNIDIYIRLDTFNWSQLGCQNCQPKYWQIKRESAAYEASFRLFKLLFILVLGSLMFISQTLTLKLYIIEQMDCYAVYWYFMNINLYFYKLLVVLTYCWSLWVTSVKLLSHCKDIFTEVLFILWHCCPYCLLEVCATALNTTMTLSVLRRLGMWVALIE